MKSWAVFDVEGDGLKPTKLYCLSYMDYTGFKKTLTEYDEIKEFFTKYEIYIGHNIVRWDIPWLVRLVLGVKPDKVFIDTLGLGWHLHPDRGQWNLDSYGPDYGIIKPAIDDWSERPLAEYIHRCQEDTRITFALWQDLLETYKLLYSGDPEGMMNFFKYITFKLECAHEAEKNRWKLDVEYCTSALAELSELRDAKRLALAKAMPKVAVTKKYHRPKVMRRANGELSTLGQRWYERLDRHGLPHDYDGVVTEIVDYIQGNPGSTHQIKAWLYSLGWVPRTIKHDRNKKTGELKEIPQVNKERGDGICDSIKELYEKEPALEYLDGLSILKHRCDILAGFLRDCSDDGFLYAGVSGFTNTLRLRHAVLVNLPRPTTEYGDVIRSCLITRNINNLLCGSDMSGLEDKLKQHFIYPYDPDYVVSLQSPDYDPHIDIAVLAGMMSDGQAEAYRAGDHSLKNVRSVAKNGNYSCQYGAGPPRVAITCGITLEAGEQLHRAYWERNWAIKEVSKSQTTKTVRGQLFLYNPISGFWYTLRHHKDIFSTLVQGSASFVFDLWLRFVLAGSEGLADFLGQFHDEFIFEHPEDNKEVMEHTVIADAIKKVNEALGLNVELSVGVEFGNNYAEIH